jgi:hypothetical protein
MGRRARTGVEAAKVKGLRIKFEETFAGAKMTGLL